MVVVDTHSEGEDITKYGYPENVGGVYTIKGFQVGSRDGGLSTSALKLYRGAPRISTNADERISEYQQELKRITYLLSQEESKLSDISTELNHLHRQQSQNRADIINLNRELGKKKNETTRLIEQLHVRISF